MDTLKAIRNRRSVRSYTGEKFAENDLQTILMAANAAPVGMGRYENVHLTVIENPELLGAIDRNAAQVFGRPDMKPLYGAPLFILVSARPTMDAIGNTDYSNTAIVVHNMALAAVELGVGSCYIWGATMALAGNPELVAQLGLPDGFSPCCGIVLGATAEKYTDREIPEDRIATVFVK